MGSAMNTPNTPKFVSRGNNSASGTTMKALRSNEKNVACRALPSATKLVCPTICMNMAKKAQK